MKMLAKTRLGCLESRLETGRWARPRLAGEARIGLVCENVEQNVENDYHFIFKCSKYQFERLTWLEKLTTPEHFLELPEGEQIGLILNHPSNVKLTAQYLINIFDVRSRILSKTPSEPKVLHLLPHEQCPAWNPVQY